MIVSKIIWTFLFFELIDFDFAVVVPGPENYDAQARQILIRHNFYRQAHNSTPLTLDKKLSEESLELAKAMSEINELFKLRPGINAFAQKNSSDFRNFNTWFYPGGNAIPVDLWYQEIQFYNVGKKHLARNFSQVIWKSSEKLGVGLAQSATNITYVICKYYPVGNIADAYEHNVFNATINNIRLNDNFSDKLDIINETFSDMEPSPRSNKRLINNAKVDFNFNSTSNFEEHSNTSLKTSDGRLIGEAIKALDAIKDTISDRDSPRSNHRLINVNVIADLKKAETLAHDLGTNNDPRNENLNIGVNGTSGFLLASNVRLYSINTSNILNVSEKNNLETNLTRKQTMHSKSLVANMKPINLDNVLNDTSAGVRKNKIPGDNLKANDDRLTSKKIVSGPNVGNGTTRYNGSSLHSLNTQNILNVTTDSKKNKSPKHIVFINGGILLNHKHSKEFETSNDSSHSKNVFAEAIDSPSSTLNVFVNLTHPDSPDLVDNLKTVSNTSSLQEPNDTRQLLEQAIREASDDISEDLRTVLSNTSEHDHVVKKRELEWSILEDVEQTLEEELNFLMEGNTATDKASPKLNRDVKKDNESEILPTTEKISRKTDLILTIVLFNNIFMIVFGVIVIVCTISQCCSGPVVENAEYNDSPHSMSCNLRRKRSIAHSDSG